LLVDNLKGIFLLAKNATTYKHIRHLFEHQVVGISSVDAVEPCWCPQTMHHVILACISPLQELLQLPTHTLHHHTKVTVSCPEFVIVGIRC